MPLCNVGRKPQLASRCLDSALGAGAHLTSLLELFILDPSRRAECWLWSFGTGPSLEVQILALQTLSR